MIIKGEEEYADINDLVQLLLQVEVANIVDDYYLKYDNPVPGELIREAIEKVKTRLIKAPQKV